MSVALEITIQWVPWIVGTADACLLAYYANNFDLTDEDLTHGTLSGASGNAIMGVSAATLAVEIWALIDWIKREVKNAEGRRTVHNRNAHYGRAMRVYEVLIFMFYIVAITSAALNVTLVANFEQLAVTVDGSQLQGAFGTATAALAYTTIGFAGLAFFTYL